MPVCRDFSTVHSLASLQHYLYQNQVKFVTKM